MWSRKSSRTAASSISIQFWSRRDNLYSTILIKYAFKISIQFWSRRDNSVVPLA
jgi:hypothetical protein